MLQPLLQFHLFGPVEQDLHEEPRIPPLGVSKGKIDDRAETDRSKTRNGSKGPLDLPHRLPAAIQHTIAAGARIAEELVAPFGEADSFLPFQGGIQGWIDVNQPPVLTHHEKVQRHVLHDHPNVFVLDDLGKGKVPAHSHQPPISVSSPVSSSSSMAWATHGSKWVPAPLRNSSLMNLRSLGSL